MNPLKFLSLAQDLATKSKDKSTKVGAIAMDEDGDIVAVGYNGFPRGVNDDDESRHERPVKYLYTAHAEENLVAQAARKGARLKGTILVVTALHPCATCARMIIQSGIRHVYAPRPTVEPRWKDQADVAAVMLQEAGIRITYY